MTEIKTNEQILAKSLDTTVEKLYNSGFVHQALKAMQESNDQAVRVALEMAAETLSNEHVRNYLTNLHSQVMEKLKTPTK